MLMARQWKSLGRIAAVALLAIPQSARMAYGADSNSVSSETLQIRGAFHIAGVPGMRRNAKADLVLTTRNVTVVHGDKEALVVPYGRLRHASILPAEREYAKSAYAAVLALGAPGALVLMKKRKVDGLAFEYENEQGGMMSMLLQVPKGDGEKCREWLARFGVRFEEPAPSPWLSDKK
jgi:hypothetical protein